MNTVLFDIAMELTETEQGRLAELEAVVDRGQKVFIEVGRALTEIRDSKLYRETHKTFEEYCQERWGFTRMRASQFISAAEVVENLNVNNCLQTPATESQARPLARLEPEIQPIAWQESVATAPNGKVTAAHIESVVRRFIPPIAPDEDEQELDALAGESDGYDWTPEPEPSPIPQDETKDSDEYYTPKYIIDAARAVMGAIDLDPATCELAQTIVRAERYYTKADNSLLEPWHGRVWLNPPFSKPGPFIAKAIEEYTDSNITEAIVLVNNGTETAWGQALLIRFPVCFVGANGGRGSRIAFWNEDPDQPQRGNRYSQMIFYMGETPEKFFDVFSQFGAILEPR